MRRRLSAEALREAQTVLRADLDGLAGAAQEADHCSLGLQDAEDRRVEIVERFREVTAAVAGREQWMADHPTEVEWMVDLSRRVTSRRRDLAVAAERRPSPHHLRLLGPPARYGADREHWLDGAGALDAYREQWRVKPDDLGQETNLRGAQAVAWERVRAQLGPGPARTGVSRFGGRCRLLSAEWGSTSSCLGRRGVRSQVAAAPADLGMPSNGTSGTRANRSSGSAFWETRAFVVAGA